MATFIPIKEIMLLKAAGAYIMGWDPISAIDGNKGGGMRGVGLKIDRSSTAEKSAPIQDIYRPRQGIVPGAG